MPSHRVARHTEDVKREIADIMRTLKDPRVTGMLSIVKVELSSDYSWCKVYVSSMDGMEGAKSAVEGLKSAAGYIRRELGSRVAMRKTPELKFIADDGIEYSADLNLRLKNLVRQESEPDADAED